MASLVSAPRVSSSTVPDGPDISDDYGEFLGLSEGIDALDTWGSRLEVASQI